MDTLTVDIWDSKEKKFNQNNMQILLNHITGKPNATMGDIEALFGGEPIYTNATTLEASGEGDPNGTYYQEYSSKVVRSDLLNRNANKITPGISDDDKSKGLCLTLKGKIFRVTSLTRTLPTNENPEGYIVGTLLLKEPEGNMQWNSIDDKKAKNPEPSNMYGTSDIRRTLIGKGGWLDTFIGSEINFAENYFIKPKYIGYQLEQRAFNRGKITYSGGTYFKYSLPNEALKDIGNYYRGYDYYNNGNMEKRNKYISWGNDYAWLPSLTEMGCVDWYDYWNMEEISIWGMSRYHRGWLDDSEDRRAWLRSGFADDYGYVYRLGSGGGNYNPGVTGSCGLRPALHFNLSTAIKNM